MIKEEFKKYKEESDVILEKEKNNYRFKNKA